MSLSILVVSMTIGKKYLITLMDGSPYLVTPWELLKAISWKARWSVRCPYVLTILVTPTPRKGVRGNPT